MTQPPDDAALVERYTFTNGWTMQREDGISPNGNPYRYAWVLRSSKGARVDFDRYRHDIIARNRLVVVTDRAALEPSDKGVGR